MFGNRNLISFDRRNSQPSEEDGGRDRIRECIESLRRKLNHSHSPVPSLMDQIPVDMTVHANLGSPQGAMNDTSTGGGAKTT